MAEAFMTLLIWMLRLYSWVIVIRAFLSWFRVDPYHPVMQFLIQITEPLLEPLRRLLPPVGGLDITPMAAIVILWAVQQLLVTIAQVVF
jgi:YggT family protein